MNKTDPKFPQLRSLSKPIIRKSASPSHEGSLQDIPSLFACQNELERTKDEISHLKKSINRKSNEITQTKADITRYEETLKKNLKVIEDISMTTDKSTSIAIGKLLFDPNQTKLPTDISLSLSHVIKFKELLAVNLLKSKNKELSEVISTKKSEIDLLKNDSKSNSITKLENTFLLNATELKELKINYDSLQSKYKEMYGQAEKIIDERDQLKAEMNKYKSEYLISKAKLAQLQSSKISQSNLSESLSLKDISKKEGSSNASQHTKEQSDTSLSKKALDAGKAMINAYQAEKAKLEKRIEELCNANMDADERNEAKESLLKKKMEEYAALLEKSKRLQSEVEAKKRDSDKEEALKKQIDKLKREKHALTEKINNLKEKDLAAKLNEESQKVKEMEAAIQTEKEKNNQLKETIESDKINERILAKKIEDDKARIEALRKEIEELKRRQEMERQNKLLHKEEKEQFFATGINVNVKARYGVDIDNEEVVNEKEEEQEEEQVKEEEDKPQVQEPEGELNKEIAIEPKDEVNERIIDAEPHKDEQEADENEVEKEIVGDNKEQERNDLEHHSNPIQEEEINEQPNATPYQDQEFKGKEEEPEQQQEDIEEQPKELAVEKEAKEIEEMDLLNNTNNKQGEDDGYNNELDF